ncbi:DUF5103 domain-containing protein [Pedobacter sp. MC2016-14]|uniref:type IX secretion system plug protein n=1 Tax=Pedobacter sp. MC2016-14 TaxID=2897327 RepID=UPI001E411F3D|nr:DUF5103 domain-containing protein [Pedobacter sp. MC2016-14]MCD0489117.1 DUF5103 domain-containing protein [Pedobacter sp. MC2016-14]
MKTAGLLFLLTLLSLAFNKATAQQGFVYDNQIYLAQIQTVQCYNSQKEQSMPVITLKSAEQIKFSFDDLNGGSKNYWYTVEHCTSDWKSSRLSPLDYLEGMTDDRIVDYQYSSNTLQKYTHYALSLPNDQLKIKISGNYLLKVYLDGNLKKPVVSQRFYVVENTVTIGAEVVPSNQVPDRNLNQKINFSIFHPNPIQNPYTDIKAIVMQNGIPQTAITNTRPSFIKPGTLVYNDLNTNDFRAGNQFRKFDTRSFRYKAQNVQNIIMDSTVNVILFNDISGNSGKYTSQFDENGNFFIRNQDGRDNDTESDYAHVLFTLGANAPGADGDVYVVGRFNNYNLTESNKLNWQPSKKRFYGNLLLKQGVYDYKYVWRDNKTGKIDDTALEGSFFETENAYQIFVYFRKPGSRWDELIGYTNIGTLVRN